MSSSKLVGIGFVAFGVLLLLAAVTDFSFSFGDWWPLILVLVGLGSLSKGSRTGGSILLGLGVLFLLRNLGVLEVNLWVLWPVVLIVIGLSILFGGRRRKSKSGGFTGAPPAPGDDLSIESTFGNENLRVDNKEFRGGSVSATFAGVEIDLRGAAIAGEAATLHVTAVFGGVKLAVPDDWAVDVRVSTTLGGVDTKRAAPSREAATLILTGSLTFAGIEITS